MLKCKNYNINNNYSTNNNNDDNNNYIAHQ